MRLSTAMGFWGAWGGTGSFIAGIITPTIFENLGFKGTWAFFALVVVVLVGLFCVLIKTPPQEVVRQAMAAAQPSDSASIKKPHYRELFTRNVLCYFVGFITINFAVVGFVSWVPTVLQMQGYNATLSGVASTLPMLICVVSSPVLGVISDKTQRIKPFILAGMVVLSICSALMFTQTGIVLWIACIVLGLFGTAILGPLLSFYTAILPRPELGPLGMGLFALMQGIGQFLGSFLMQLLLGPNLDHYLFAAIALFAIQWVGIIVVALFVKCR